MSATKSSCLIIKRPATTTTTLDPLFLYKDNYLREWSTWALSGHSPEPQCGEMGEKAGLRELTAYLSGPEPTGSTLEVHGVFWTIPFRGGGIMWPGSWVTRWCSIAYTAVWSVKLLKRVATWSCDAAQGYARTEPFTKEVNGCFGIYRRKLWLNNTILRSIGGLDWWEPVIRYPGPRLLTHLLYWARH